MSIVRAEPVRSASLAATSGSTSAMTPSTTRLPNSPGGSVCRRHSAWTAAQSVGAGQPRTQQPVADCPSVQRVELDGERVVELLVVADQRDAQPLPQERLRRVLEEGDQVVEGEFVRLVGRSQRWM